MISGGSNINPATTHKVVLPFYIYAAVALFAATIQLYASTDAFSTHHFQPQILAITHTMALGWGTMIILGASYQLLPVLIERELYSNRLAYISFLLSGIGIPLLIGAFIDFNMNWPAQLGAVMINAAIALYLVNVIASIRQTKRGNIHATFMLTAAVWLFITTLVGGLLVFNFSWNILPENSIKYLSLHAHVGIAGWFLLLIIGVGSRLVPMFLLSKYTCNRLLWWIYLLVNGGIILFILIFLSGISGPQLIPAICIALAVALFGYYCRMCFKERIRRKVDSQMKLSLFSVLMILIPLLFLAVIFAIVSSTSPHPRLVLVYGFTIFFGWITAIILGMTFKTLPFIVWNRIYHASAGIGKTPNPKDMFSERLFNIMTLTYLVGFSSFAIGILNSGFVFIKTGALLLIGSAFFYILNVLKIIFHKVALNECEN